MSWRLLILTLALLSACSRRTTPYAWDLPEGFPAPPVPQHNPLTDENVRLGRHLFYDVRLSANQTQSCASCHKQELGFTDGRAVALGSTGQLHFRNTQGLANIAYATTLTWANPLLTQLENQALIPLFGERPVEMGMSGREQELFARLARVPRYRELFSAAYPEDAVVFDLPHVTQALASFLRTLVSYRSAYDRYVYGKDEQALSSSAQRGMELFFSERLECFHCHNGFNFSDATVHAESGAQKSTFHNTGLFDVDGHGAYPNVDRGLFDQTQLAADMGRFRAPSLRNVALTAPYMHDGSMATLEEVLAHYAEGGRTIHEGPNRGDGTRNAFKSSFLRGFVLNQSEQRDVIAFLHSLTDHELARDRRFADPWMKQPQRDVRQAAR